MTIIVARNSMMCADSGAVSGTFISRCVTPKIVRDKHGLFGASGRTSDCVVAQRWFSHGMLLDRPEIADKERFGAIWMDPSGVVWDLDETLRPYREENGGVAGMNDACNFVLGAMAAGADPATAVRLACKSIAHLLGPVQVERV